MTSTLDAPATPPSDGKTDGFNVVKSHDAIAHEAAVDLLGRELCRTHLIEPIDFQDDILTIGYSRSELPADVRSAIQRRIGHAHISVRSTSDTEQLRHRLESLWPTDTTNDLPESLVLGIRTALDCHAEELILRPNAMGGAKIGGWVEMIVHGQRRTIKAVSPDTYLDMRNALAQRAFGNDKTSQLQRGQISRVIDGRHANMRVTSVPTAGRGEDSDKTAHVQLRIQRPYYLLPPIESFGFTREQEHALLGSAGLAGTNIVIAAPPSNGKTTLAYRLILTFPLDRMNVFTAEQPAEIFIPGVSPLRIDTKALSMNEALIATLSLNPHLIFAGESLEETTMRLVIVAMSANIPTLTTYHAESAATIPYRMDCHGIDPSASGRVNVLVATRLVPTLCESCKVTHGTKGSDGNKVVVEPGATVKRLLKTHRIEQAAPAHRRPGGCVDCGGTGASGQTGVGEIFFVDAATRQLIQDRKWDAVRTHLHNQGLPTMMDRGIRLFAEGKIDERDFIAKLVPTEVGFEDLLPREKKGNAA